MSDSPLSDTDIKNKTAWVWTTLKSMGTVTVDGVKFIFCRTFSGDVGINRTNKRRKLYQA